MDAPSDPRLPSEFANNGSTRNDLISSLTDAPNKWVVIGQHKTRNSANQVKIKLKHRFPDHAFRLETRDGQVVMFALYPDEDTTP